MPTEWESPTLKDECRAFFYELRRLIVITLATLQVVYDGRKIDVRTTIPAEAHTVGVAGVKFVKRTLLGTDDLFEHGLDAIRHGLEASQARLLAEFRGAWEDYPLLPAS